MKKKKKKSAYIHSQTHNPTSKFALAIIFSRKEDALAREFGRGVMEPSHPANIQPFSRLSLQPDVPVALFGSHAARRSLAHRPHLGVFFPFRPLHHQNTDLLYQYYLFFNCRSVLHQQNSIRLERLAASGMSGTSGARTSHTFIIVRSFI